MKMFGRLIISLGFVGSGSFEKLVRSSKGEGVKSGNKTKGLIT